jgi:hypothetical protein
MNYNDAYELLDTVDTSALPGFDQINYRKIARKLHKWLPLNFTGDLTVDDEDNISVKFQTFLYTCFETLVKSITGITPAKESLILHKLSIKIPKMLADLRVLQNDGGYTSFVETHFKGTGKKPRAFLEAVTDPDLQCLQVLPRATCYICGKAFTLSADKKYDMIVVGYKGTTTAHKHLIQCEHVLPISEALFYLDLLQTETQFVSAQAQRQPLYKAEYLWAHMCCNYSKNDLSYIASIIGSKKFSINNNNIDLTYTRMLNKINLHTTTAGKATGSGKKGDQCQYLFEAADIQAIISNPSSPVKASLISEVQKVLDIINARIKVIGKQKDKNGHKFHGQRALIIFKYLSCIRFLSNIEETNMKLALTKIKGGKKNQKGGTRTTYIIDKDSPDIKITFDNDKLNSGEMFNLINGMESIDVNEAGNVFDEDNFAIEIEYMMFLYNFNTFAKTYPLTEGINKIDLYQNNEFINEYYNDVFKAQYAAEIAAERYPYTIDPTYVGYPNDLDFSGNLLLEFIANRSEPNTVNNNESKHEEMPHLNDDRLGSIMVNIESAIRSKGANEEFIGFFMGTLHEVLYNNQSIHYLEVPGFIESFNNTAIQSVNQIVDTYNNNKDTDQFKQKYGNGKLFITESIQLMLATVLMITYQLQQQQQKIRPTQHNPIKKQGVNANKSLKRRINKEQTRRNTQRAEYMAQKRRKPEQQPEQQPEQSFSMLSEGGSYKKHRKQHTKKRKHHRQTKKHRKHRN